MPTVTFGGVPARGAIQSIQDRGKNLVPTERWDDMRGAVHARSFTVAGATKADLLQDLHGAVQTAITDGMSIGEFRQTFDKVVQDHGWQYNGSRSWRTRVIYETNMRTAHAAGKWQRIQSTKRALPYLVYMTVGDAQVRDQHRKWHRAIVLPVDHPFWQRYYPPNDWGCRCYVIQASAAMLKRMGIDITPDDQLPSSETPRVNTSTGEDYGMVPEGIGVGWDYNVGQAWLGPDIALGRSLAQSPPVVRAAIMDGMSHTATDSAFSRWAVDMLKPNGLAGQLQPAGHILPAVLDALEQRGEQLTTTALSISSDRLRRMQRASKTSKQLHISDKALHALPSYLRNPLAVLREKDSGALIYVFEDPSAPKGKVAKIVVGINYKEKRRELTNSIRSGGVVNRTDLKNQGKYERLIWEMDKD